jgi:hypothetical protein
MKFMTATPLDRGYSAQRIRRDARTLELAATACFEQSENLLQQATDLNRTARQMRDAADALDDADEIGHLTGTPVDVVLAEMTTSKDYGK